MVNRVLRFFWYVLAMQGVLGILSFMPNHSIFNKFRGWAVRPFFLKCGKRFQLAKGVLINSPWGITVGDDVYIAHDVWMNGVGGLHIGDGVIISPKVVISTAKHSYVNGAIALRKSINSPIFIERGVWVASNSVVTMGTTIGEGSIIGALSVVTHDIPRNYFAAGSPAKPIKSLL